MKIDVINKKENPFLKREEILIQIENRVCPKKSDILSSLGFNPDISIVKKIKSYFGKNIFRAEIFVYKSVEEKNKIEKIQRRIRKKILEETKKQQEKKEEGGK